VVESGGKLPAFSGKYYYTLDPKGRVIIPAPFREIISSNYNPKLYVVNDIFDNCIHIYPQEERSKLE
jgi:MraZ protein